MVGRDGTLLRVSTCASCLAAVPFDWSTDSPPWIGLATVVAVGAGVHLLSRLLRRVRALERSLVKLELLERMDTSLARLLDEPSAPDVEVDLRPVEDALRLLGEEQRRHTDRVVQALDAVREAAARSLAAEPPEPPAPVVVESRVLPESLVDRVVDRLLALGYERVEFVTPAEQLESVFQRGGEVRVEARRDGAPHKGRVVVREGRIDDVHLRSSYETFP